MKTRLRHFIVATGLLAAAGLVPACKDTTATTATMPPDEAAARFALDLYREHPEGGNLFFSPYSIASALGMTALGARGETERQMREVLFAGGDHHAALGEVRQQLSGDHPFQLEVANALWLQEGFAVRDGFLAATRDHYDAAPHMVDFQRQTTATIDRINGWVAERTQDRIRDLLSPAHVNAMTRLVLTNAIYFKGAWQDAFSKGATTPAPFHRPDGTTVEAPLMRRVGQYGYREQEDAQVLRLPYTGREAAMIVLLPRAADGLPALVATLTPTLLRDLAAGDGEVVQAVDVWLPRLRIEQTLDLPETLAALGMPAAFDPASADFSGINGSRDLYLGAVVHKAFVAVDEAGTEAAAATAAGVMVTSMPMPPKDPVEFRADRAFLFLIVHRPTGTVLFLGRLTDPS